MHYTHWLLVGMLTGLFGTLSACGDEDARSRVEPSDPAPEEDLPRTDPDPSTVNTPPSTDLAPDPVADPDLGSHCDHWLWRDMGQLVGSSMRITTGDRPPDEFGSVWHDTPEHGADILFHVSQTLEGNLSARLNALTNVNDRGLQVSTPRHQPRGELVLRRAHQDVADNTIPGAPRWQTYDQDDQVCYWGAYACRFTLALDRDGIYVRLVVFQDGQERLLFELLVPHEACQEQRDAFLARTRYWHEAGSGEEPPQGPFVHLLSDHGHASHGGIVRHTDDDGLARWIAFGDTSDTADTGPPVHVVMRY